MCLKWRSCCFRPVPGNWYWSGGWEAECGVCLSRAVKHDWERMTEAVQNHIGSLNWGYRVALREKKVTYENAYGEFVGPHRIKVSVWLPKKVFFGFVSLSFCWGRKSEGDYPNKNISDPDRPVAWFCGHVGAFSCGGVKNKRTGVWGQISRIWILALCLLPSIVPWATSHCISKLLGRSNWSL